MKYLCGRRVLHAVLGALVCLACLSGCSDPESESNGNDNGETDAGSNDTESDDTGSDAGSDAGSDTGEGDAADACAAVDCTAPGQNAIGECVDGSCEYSCEERWLDADGDLIGAADPAGSNGCELECSETNGGVEVCDDVDNDCNGQIDDDPEDGTTYYADTDADGYGDPGNTVEACEQPTDYVSEDTDCDDDDADAYPGAPGLCDGVDNDCNSDVDELKMVEGGSNTYTPSADSTSSDANLEVDGPPEALAVETDDGFCTVQYDARLRITTYAAINTADQQVVTKGVSGLFDRQILDIAWDGTDCAIMYLVSRSSGPELFIERWNPRSNAAPVSQEVSSGETLPPDTNMRRWAALHSACIEFVSSRPCESSWVVAWAEKEQETDEAFQLNVQGFLAGFTDASSVGNVSVVDDNMGEIAYGLDIGPSPATDDALAVFFRDGESGVNAWKFAATKTGLGDFVVRRSLTIDTDTNDYRRPVLDAAGSDVFLVTQKSVFGNQLYEVRSLVWSAANSGEYSYGSSLTQTPGPVGSSTTLRFPSRNLMSSGPVHDFWFLATYFDSDYLRPINDATSLSAASETFRAMPEGGVATQYLTARDDGADTIEVLSLTNGDPFEYTVDRITCH